MEKNEYIWRASQVVEKAREAGFYLNVNDFLPCRIYPQNGRDHGYIAFVAEVESEGVPSYLYVKAYSGKTPRTAIIIPQEGTKIEKYGEYCSFKAMGKTVWHYVKVDNDFELIPEDEYYERKRKEAREKEAAAKKA